MVRIGAINLGQRIVYNAAWQVVEVAPAMYTRSCSPDHRDIAMASVHEGVTQHLNDHAMHIEPSEDVLI